MAYGTISVDSNTAIEIVPANPQRLSLLLVNMGAGVVYLGDNSSVTTATGLAITSGTNLAEDMGGTKLYCGSYFGIANTAATVRYWERIR
jgi:hypothetical protein